MKKITVFVLGLGFLFCTTFAFAVDVHFQWGASTGQVDGYRIYWGDTQAGPYSNLLSEVNGTITDYMAPLSEAQEYYLVCRAFNAYGESGDSNEVHWNYALPGAPGSLQWSIDLLQVLESLGADKIQFISK